jgi:hypothetical protein
MITLSSPHADLDDNKFQSIMRVGMGVTMWVPDKQSCPESPMPPFYQYFLRSCWKLELSERPSARELVEQLYNLNHPVVLEWMEHKKCIDEGQLGDDDVGDGAVAELELEDQYAEFIEQGEKWKQAWCSGGDRIVVLTGALSLLCSC